MENNDRQKDEIKRKINDVNRQLELQKSNLNNLNGSEERINHVHKKIDECIATLSLSIKGQKISNELKLLSDENDFSKKVTSNNFDMKRQEISQSIKHCYDELEELEKNNKKDD